MLLWEFSKTSNTISTAVSLGKFVHQILLKWSVCRKKVNFLKKQKQQILASHIAVKTMNNKHSQVLLVSRKNPRKWNYEWSSVLKTSTALIVGIFERFCCFDEVFLMALISTEQLYMERPLYRHILHNDHLPDFQ